MRAIHLATMDLSSFDSPPCHSPLSAYVCILPVSLHVCVYVCVQWTVTCACARGGQRLMSGVFLHYSPICIFRQSLSLTLELAHSG